MKNNILLSVLLCLGIALPINTLLAVTVVTDIPGETNIDETTTNQFGLSGVVNIYDADESIIVINGVRYALENKGELSDDDLSKGQEVKFNVEQSSNDYISRITRIWIEAEQ